MGSHTERRQSVLDSHQQQLLAVVGILLLPVARFLAVVLRADHLHVVRRRLNGPAMEKSTRLPQCARLRLSGAVEPTQLRGPTGDDAMRREQLERIE